MKKSKFRIVPPTICLTAVLIGCNSGHSNNFVALWQDCLRANSLQSEPCQELLRNSDPALKSLGKLLETPLQIKDIYFISKVSSSFSSNETDKKFFDWLHSENESLRFQTAALVTFTQASDQLAQRIAAEIPSGSLKLNGLEWDILSNSSIPGKYSKLAQSSFASAPKAARILMLRLFLIDPNSDLRKYALLLKDLNEDDRIVVAKTLFACKHPQIDLLFQPLLNDKSDTVREIAARLRERLSKP